jgi:hypothetical protein
MVCKSLGTQGGIIDNFLGGFVLRLPAQLFDGYPSTSMISCGFKIRLKKRIFGSNQRCSYRCPPNPRLGGPPPLSGVYGANTGFSLTAYIKQEIYCTAATLSMTNVMRTVNASFASTLAETFARKRVSSQCREEPFQCLPCLALPYSCSTTIYG